MTDGHPAVPDIVALRLVVEGPDDHVLDHAVAKVADRACRSSKAPVLRLEFWNLNPQDGMPARHRLSISWLARPSSLAPLRAQRIPARAGSLSDPGRTRSDCLPADRL